jgi:putative autotransporter adhesin-like protein
MSALANTALATACLACGLSALAGCVQSFDGNGVPAEEARTATGFDRVSARGALDIEVERGDFAVGVSIDENLISRVATNLDGRSLLIRFEGGNLGDHLPGPHVRVRMPVLTDVELNGSGRLTARGFDGEEPANVELSGSGEVNWSGSSDSLDVVLNGSGDLTVTGEATRAHYFLAGSGTLDARELTAAGANIELEGSGSIQATVNGRVDARIEGSGTIELLGNVTRGDWSQTEEGAITEE